MKRQAKFDDVWYAKQAAWIMQLRGFKTNIYKSHRGCILQWWEN